MDSIIQTLPSSSSNIKLYRTKLNPAILVTVFFKRVLLFWLKQVIIDKTAAQFSLGKTFFIKKEILSNFPVCCSRALLVFMQVRGIVSIISIHDCLTNPWILELNKCRFKKILRKICLWNCLCIPRKYARMLHSVYSWNPQILQAWPATKMSNIKFFECYRILPFMW